MIRIRTDRELMTGADVAPRDPLPGGGSVAKFLNNAGLGGARGLILLANTVILVPLLIHYLGNENFGVLALVTPFLRYGFNGIFDFGFNTGVVRYVSRAHAAEDHAAVNSFVISALAVYLIFDVVCVLGLWFGAPYLARVLIHSDAQIQTSAILVFRRIAVVYAVLLLSNPFFALVMGLQKTHLSHVIGGASLLMELVGILLLLPFGLNISRVVVVYAANAILSFLLAYVVARKSCRFLRISWAGVQRKRVYDLLHYGLRFSVTVSTGILAPIIDKLILARFVGLSFVAIYESAARLIDILKRTSQLLLLPLFPLAGARESTDAETKRRLYGRVFDFNFLLSAALFLFPLPLSFALFRMWLGSNGYAAALAFMFLGVTSFALSLVYPALLIFAATGRMAVLMVTGVLSLAFNLTLSPLIALRYGYFGVLASGAFIYITMTLAMIVWIQRQREFQLDLRNTCTASAWAVVSAVLPGILLVRISNAPGRVSQIVVVVGAAIVLSSALVMLRRETRVIMLQIVQAIRSVLATRSRVLAEALARQG